jgi:hypothetical protein
MLSTTGWATDMHRMRHVGDFCRWKDHNAYQIAFERLHRDLKASGTKQAKTTGST